MLRKISNYLLIAAFIAFGLFIVISLGRSQPHLRTSASGFDWNGLNQTITGAGAVITTVLGIFLKILDSIMQRKAGNEASASSGLPANYKRFRQCLPGENRGDLVVVEVWRGNDARGVPFFEPVWCHPV